MGRYPEVADAVIITGEADALVHIRAADVRHFEDVMERIRAEPFVVDQDPQRDRAVPAGRSGRGAGAAALSPAHHVRSAYHQRPEQLKSCACRSLKIRVRIPGRFLGLCRTW